MRISFILIISMLSSGVFSQEFPLGYQKAVFKSFSKQADTTDLILSSNTSMNIQSGKLYIHSKEQDTSCFFPNTCVILNNHVFGEYIVNLSIKYDELPSGDTCSAIYLIAGLRDSSNYYFVEFSSTKTEFGSVYNGVQTILKSDSSFVLQSGKQNELKITRDILTRKISVQSGSMETEFSDPNLVMGFFGFGTQGAKLEIDLFEIWSPTVIEQSAPIFQ